MSRREKLEEYQRQKKKTAQDSKSHKSVQPFRSGKVRHPMDTLAALPPVPGFRFSATSERKSMPEKPFLCELKHRGSGDRSGLVAVRVNKQYNPLQL